MNNDSFICKTCGDLLRSPMIAVYRETISHGGSVDGAIRCGRCGSIYSAGELAGISYEQLPEFHQKSKKGDRVVKNSLFLAIIVFFILCLFIFNTKEMIRINRRFDFSILFAFISFPIFIFIGQKFSKFFYNTFNSTSTTISNMISFILKTVSNKILKFLRNRRSI
jgi:hypothetical protein